MNCNYCVLNDIIAACHCSCHLLTLLLWELSFWCAKTENIQKFQRCLYVSDLVVKCCLDIIGETWIQLFFILVLLNVDASFIGVGCLFPSAGKVLSCVLQCYRNVGNWISKVVWPRNYQFSTFMVEICPISTTLYVHGLNFASTVQVCVFSDEFHGFSYFAVIVVCCSETLVKLSHRIS